jgi:hypothetical protein
LDEMLDSSNNTLINIQLCGLVPSAVSATLAVWRAAAGTAGVRDSQRLLVGASP